MYVLSPLSEELPVQKDPLFGEYFDLYSTRLVKKTKIMSKMALLAMCVLSPLSEELPVR